MENLLVEFVTFLPHSSGCDSHKYYVKKNLGALNLVTILIRIKLKKMHENWSKNP